MTWLELSGAGAAVAYVLAGVWTAVRKLDWRGKVFFVGWLPLPHEPTDPSVNRKVANTLLVGLVVALWPVYRIAWNHAWNGDRQPTRRDSPGGERDARRSGDPDGSSPR